MKRKSMPVLIEVIPSRWDDEPITRAKSTLLGLTSLGASLTRVAARASGSGSTPARIPPTRGPGEGPTGAAFAVLS